MTVTDRSGINAASSAVPAGAGLGVTQRRVLAAEALKFGSLRSLRWVLLVSVLSIIAAGVSPALTELLAGTDPAGGPGAGSDPTGGALSGISFTQLLIAALGALVVTSEYATGLIRATFSAVPRRLPVLWAKSVVAAAVTFVATLAAVVVSFFVAQAVLSAADVAISLSAPGVLRALVGSALYLAVTAVLAVAFGFLLRSAIGAIAALFALLFVLPLLGMLVPAIDPYLPNSAGAAILNTGPTADGLPPWTGLGVFALYAAAALTAAAITLTRRDT